MIPGHGHTCAHTFYKSPFKFWQLQLLVSLSKIKYFGPDFTVMGLVFVMKVLSIVHSKQHKLWLQSCLDSHILMLCRKLPIPFEAIGEREPSLRTSMLSMPLKYKKYRISHPQQNKKILT